MSTTSKAFKMFREGEGKVMVAIALNLEAREVIAIFGDYLGLLNLDRIMHVYYALGDHRFEKLYSLFLLMEEEGLLSKPAMARLVEQGGKLNRLDEECLNICGQIGRLNAKNGEMEMKIEEMTSLLAFLRKTYSETKKERRSHHISDRTVDRGSQKGEGLL